MKVQIEHLYFNLGRLTIKTFECIFDERKVNLICLELTEMTIYVIVGAGVHRVVEDIFGVAKLDYTARISLFG